MKRLLPAILSLFGIKGTNGPQTAKLEEGIRTTLKSASAKFEKNNHAYMINIIHENTVVLQIVHGGLIEQLREDGNGFNFSFNLPFDNEKENQAKFLNLEISKGFKYYEWEGIPCYAVNVKNDAQKAETFALLILQDVYGFGIEDVFKFEIFDQGKIR